MVNIFTGPPAQSGDDRKVIENFLALPGTRIVAGATTAQIVARHLGRELKINTADTSMIAPPGYSIEGIDLATEGAVTLNQLYNIFDAELIYSLLDSSVTRFYDVQSSMPTHQLHRWSGKKRRARRYCLQC